jgi:dimethylhistidine N-methyltransferase
MTTLDDPHRHGGAAFLRRPSGDAALAVALDEAARHDDAANDPTGAEAAPPAQPPLSPHDADDGTEAFAHDVLAGLSEPRKWVPCTWLYDRRGSELFEDITTLAEYYPTRTETRLLAALAPEVAGLVGDHASLVELGSGSSTKTRLLLQAMPSLARYLPLDISADFLHDAVAGLRRDFPRLAIEPVVADFSHPFHIPALDAEDPASSPRLGFFPGSTIGNFTPTAAVALLAHFAQALGPGAWLLIGVDTTQDPRRLVPAYDDARGVTAAFDLNLLTRINRELGGDFDVDAFHHEARFDIDLGRIEMHLVSDRAQVAHVRGRRFTFRPGETIHTENAYKYADPAFRALAHEAGWHCERAWRDDQGSGFTVYLARHDAD